MGELRSEHADPPASGNVDPPATRPGAAAPRVQLGGDNTRATTSGPVMETYEAAMA